MLFIREDNKVEVSSEEEGLIGSYYRAILEEDPTTKTRNEKLKVRYLKLLQENSRTPLTESVEQRFIRPVPPENVNDGVVFEEGLVVDADLRDGWWTGVVVKKMEDDKYMVYFDSPPDIIQFEKKQMRVHLDWTGSKWIRPDNKELNKSDFSSGNMVELRLDFAWLPAIIVKELENGKRVIVKHFSKSLSCSGNDKIIIVDSERVRPPRPDPSSAGEYELLDRVEAFNGYAWRQGVVRGIVFEGRYMVSFGETKVASQFSHLDLRLPMKWEDGVWHKLPKTKCGKRNKSEAMETDDVVFEKETGSHFSPKPMRNQKNDHLGNESTPENMLAKHKFKCYIRKRRKAILERHADINKTVLLSSDWIPNVVKDSAVYTKESQTKDTIMVLPFAKKSPCWKTYESPEGFKKEPQNPHFSPLLESKEEFREGYALGLMVTYSGLLEKIRNLETDVPVSQLDSLKDSFAELEKHGFNVTSSLSRIDKLLALKDRQLHILEELNGFDKKRMVESSKKRQELGDMEQKILKVKHEILKLQRQEAALEKNKEAANRKICQMESCERDLRDELEAVEFDFETILSAPW